MSYLGGYSLGVTGFESAEGRECGPAVQAAPAEPASTASLA